MQLEEKLKRGLIIFSQRNFKAEWSLLNQISVLPHFSLWKGCETKWTQRYLSELHSISQVCEESIQKLSQGVSKVWLYLEITLHQAMEGNGDYAEDLYLFKRRFKRRSLWHCQLDLSNSNQHVGSLRKNRSQNMGSNKKCTSSTLL